MRTGRLNLLAAFALAVAPPARQRHERAAPAHRRNEPEQKPAAAATFSRGGGKKIGRRK